MGMFDSLYDAEGREWQTYAFGRHMAVCRIGERVRGGAPFTYQVEVGRIEREGSNKFVDSFATFHDGVLAAVPDDRDIALPLLNYDGEWIKSPTEAEAFGGDGA